MRINVYYKITFIFGIIVAVIFCGIYAYLNSNLKKHTLERVKERLSKEAQLAGSFLAEIMVDGGDNSLNRFVDEISKDLGRRVTVIDLNGKVLGDSDLGIEEVSKVENHLLRPEVVQALKHGTGGSVRFSSTVNKEMLYEAYRFGKGMPLGVVRLSAPLVEIKLISGELRRLLIISFIFAFAFILVICLIVFLIVSKPIKRMSVITSNVIAGDFSKRIPVQSNDEIGDMAKAFNQMTQQSKLRLEEITLNKLRLEAVILSMFDGVMVVDIKGTILLMNQPLKDFLIIKGDVKGKKSIEVMRHIQVQEIVDSVIKKKKKVESREISIFCNEEKTLLVHATPILQSYRTEGAVLVFHDMTELRRLEKVRQDFVANVSHELRTPMSSIKGYTETLIDGAVEDKENAVKFLEIIYTESNRMVSLIDDILDLSKIESGRHKIELRPCNIDTILKNVIAGLEKYAKDNSIIIRKSVPDDLPNIYADESKLSQILLNLLDNAIKYNNACGEISITARDTGDFVQIDVHDTGIGISPEDQARIFERFYRVEKARSRRLGGTGLGLSIVKHIVQAHKGDVFIKSCPGKGSTFSFTIPKV